MGDGVFRGLLPLLLLSVCASARGAPSARLAREAIVEVEVSSTSTYRKGKQSIFKVQHLHDRRDWSAWGSVPSERKGAWIRLRFDQVRYLTAMQFVPGNARDRDTFNQCARPAKLKLVTSQDQRTFSFKDRRYHQSIEFEPPLIGRDLKILIEETHGNRGHGGVCLSEIYLDALENPLKSVPDLRERIDEAAEQLGGPQWRRGYTELTQIGAPALDALLSALEVPSKRAHAALALGEMGQAKTIKPLTRYAQHPDPETRHAVLFALGRLGSRAHFEPIATWMEAAFEPEERARALEALLGTGHPKALEALLDALVEGSPDEQEMALTYLPRFKRAEREVRRLLRSKTPTRRAAGVLALGVIDLNGFEKRLTRALRSEDVDAQAAAARAMARRRMAYDELRARWENEHSEIRAAAAYALGVFRRPDDVALLDDLTRDASMRVRRAAAAALSEFGGEGAAILRRLAFSGPDGATAVAAAEGYLEEDPRRERALKLLGSHHEEVRRMAGASILNSARAEALLLEALEGADPRARGAAAPLLVRLGPALIPKLIQRADAAEPTQQIALLEVLGGFGDPSIAPFLSSLYEKKPPVRVRRKIVEMFGGSSSKAWAIRTLKDALIDEDVSVQIAAVEALGALGERTAAPMLILMLSTAPKETHAAVVRALGRLRHREAVGPLAARYREQRHDVNASELRVELIKAIGRIGGSQSLPVLFDAMNDMDGRVRRAANRALQ